jgi:hypothetical protein
MTNKKEGDKLISMREKKTKKKKKRVIENIMKLYF